MFVRDYMQKEPATICGEATLLEAVDFLHTKEVLTLPVMDGDKVVGVVTDRDVRKASPSSAPKLHDHDMEYLLKKIKVSDIMSRMVVTVSPHATVEEAAKMLHDRKIKGLPVVDEGKLVGLITVNEVLEFFSELFEKNEGAATFELKLDGEAGNLMEALKIIVSHGGNIVNAMTAPIEKEGAGKEIILKVEGEDTEGIMKDLEAEHLLLSGV
jgi:acetoin utilization protein AcuB